MRTMTNFWSNPTVEPKRQYRWIFHIGAEGIATWMVKSVVKPVLTVGVAEHKFFGHTYKYPGNTTWNDISITIVDPVNPDAVNALANIVYQSGYKPPTSAELPFTTMSKEKTTNKIGEVYIKQVDAQGYEIERWTLNNAIIKSADFGGTLDYANEALIECKLELAYDWATLESKQTGVTQEVNGIMPSLNIW